MARPPRVDPTVPQIVERLRHAQRRIVSTAEWARAADEAFRGFNDLGEVRRRVAASPASEAARLIEKALLDLQLVSMVRLFDPPSRDGALHTDRLSLPVCRDLLAHPGVLEALRNDIPGWRFGDVAQNTADFDQRYVAFRDRLARLEGELLNRVELLRSFRHENIAHELRLDPLPPRPRYDQIWGMVPELTQLVEDVSFVIDGQVVMWPFGNLRWSSDKLWTSVADACLYDDQRPAG